MGVSWECNGSVMGLSLEYEGEVKLILMEIQSVGLVNSCPYCNK